MIENKNVTFSDEAIRKIISEYTDDFLPKSIDEFVLNLKERPCLRDKTVLVACD